MDYAVISKVLQKKDGIKNKIKTGNIKRKRKRKRQKKLERGGKQPFCNG